MVSDFFIGLVASLAGSAIWTFVQMIWHKLR